jgi:translation initiation factor IF-3
MDFGKYKYEQSKHERQAKKKHHTYQIKEVKVRPKIEEHDFNFKLRNARKFLMSRDKVKFTCIFRGREMTHQELGVALLDRVIAELEDIAFAETRPSLEGRALVMVMAPRKDVKIEREEGAKAAEKAGGGKEAASSKSEKPTSGA